MSLEYDSMFPSNYLSAPDLGSSTAVVTIAKVEMETMRDGKSKPVVSFSGKDKRWVLNKTNGKVLMTAYGKSATGWIGKKVQLFAQEVSGPNGLTQGIRCRAVAPPVSVAGGGHPNLDRQFKEAMREEPPFNDSVADIGGDDEAPF